MQIWGFKSSASQRCAFIFLATELVYFIDILYAILVFESSQLVILFQRMCIIQIWLSVGVINSGFKSEYICLALLSYLSLSTPNTHCL